VSTSPQYLVPDTLCHYYDRASGPFRSLSRLPLQEAEQLMATIRLDPRRFAGRRPPDYLARRHQLEQQIRDLFVVKGGQPRRASPHYLTLGPCPWLRTWYPDGMELCIPITACRSDMLSFTYGDSFPAMRVRDGRPYRGKVYTLAELPAIIAAFGLPQEWNGDGQGGPERYIEAQLWDDPPLISSAEATRQDEPDAPLRAISNVF
jgi:hypothetical protein